ncbi:MAG: trypsin-like peptidase domain-containing protein [Gemmataceae bacterium]|nr:trypsin-like peptidase domain-containing protein [Gemmataceae bacterium]
MNRLGWPLLVCACAFLGGLVSNRLLDRGPAQAWAQSPVAVGKAVPRPEDRFEEVARKVMPGVVALEALKPVVREGRSKSVEDSGSGVVVRFAGRAGHYVITNNHVIGAAPARQITIHMDDGKIVKPAKVWADPESDIALLALPDGWEGTAVPLGDSSRVRVGQWVLAFGSPFGLNQTVTHGIISAKDRGQVSLDSTIRIKDFLQTDAAINPGSSGGPLVNLDGEVIAINTAIASPSKGSAGVAFSIPVNLVKRISAQLLDGGKVERGYLGVQLAAGLDLNEALKMGLTRAQGALVEAVQPGSPADKAGLKRGDVILEMDAQPVSNDNQFINRIAALAPGKKVQLKVWRSRKAFAAEAVVGDWNAVSRSFRR